MFTSDNESNLTTGRVTKAMKHEGMKPAQSMTGDQSRRVNNWARENSRSKNGTIPSVSSGDFGRFVK